MRYNFQISSVISNNLLKTNFAFHNLAHHAEIFPVIPEFDGTLSMFDVDKIPEVIDRGEQAIRAQLPHIKRLI